MSEISSMRDRVARSFKREFDKDPLIFRSPGRVNLLGEHTDYNQGFVLPAAIDKAIYVGIAQRTDEYIQLLAQDFNEKFSCRLDEVAPSQTQWANYILGVVDQLKKRGHVLQGFSLVVDGDVPIGAGLSSSAAVECAVVYALNAMFALNLSKLEMVQIAQKAEHEYAGVFCGIMDQFASMFGKANHVIKLDCQTLNYEYFPFQQEGIDIVLLNTNVKHNLASSEYNIRREQCEKGVDMVHKHIADVKSLRDVSLKMLDQYVKQEGIIYRRCRYIVEENARLQLACMDLQQGNLQDLGKKMFSTHEGLSKAYEVSCRELDFLVEQAKQCEGILGARMMGGGFGGCTINLVEKAMTDEFISTTKTSYEEAMHLPLTAYTASIDEGTSFLGN